MNNSSDISLKNYILPIFLTQDESTFVGTAFCINNYLITAGHVVSNFRMYYVKSEGKFYELSPYNWIERLIPTDDNSENDIAVYSLSEFRSPLSIAKDSPEYDTEANVTCWQKENNTVKQVDTNSLILGDDESEYFYILATLERITHGASGCPIIQGNKVVGMLTMGIDKCVLNMKALQENGISPDMIDQLQTLNNNTCHILRPEFINDILNKLPIK